VTYVSGVDTAAEVEERYKQAIKMLGAELYEHRESTDYQNFRELPYGVQQILMLDRRIPI
jgi:hypothetical protein